MSLCALQPEGDLRPHDLPLDWCRGESLASKGEQTGFEPMAATPIFERSVGTALLFPGRPWLSLVLLSILAFPGSPWPSLTLPRPPLLWALGNFEKAFQKLIASTSFCFPAVPGFPADLSGMCIPKSLDIPALPLKTLGTTVELNASGCKMPQCSFHYNLRMMSLCFPESPLPHLLGPHRRC